MCASRISEKKIVKVSYSSPFFDLEKCGNLASLKGPLHQHTALVQFCSFAHTIEIEEFLLRLSFPKKRKIFQEFFVPEIFLDLLFCFSTSFSFYRLLGFTSFQI